MKNELKRSIGALNYAFVGVFLLSAFVNILYLTGSLFMLEIYDRVLPSRSIPTLVGLCIIAAVLYLFQGLIDVVRGRVLVRISSAIDARVGPSVIAAVRGRPLRGIASGDALQPLRDLDTVRGFVAGGGPQAFFDLPWLPFYVAICWGFHPFIGGAALGGSVVLFMITLISEMQSRAPAKASAEAASARIAQADSIRRNAEIVQALGMAPFLAERFEERSARYRTAQQRAADITLDLGGASKIVRMMVQSGVLAIGALLVIEQQATGGVIIAASILSARALAPAELVIANWRNFVAARDSWRRLSQELANVPPHSQAMSLPPPRRGIEMQAVFGAPPGSQRIVIQDASLALSAGQGLGIIGPSGSGKSSLVRLLVGVWQPLRGKVRIDGAAIDQWRPEELSRHLGYLPQDIELFAGSIAENISRFDPKAESADVIAAAKEAGVHELVLSLPEGYATKVGEGGAALSAGQRQRIALARALYGEPFLVVLDEPNSNLDSEGEEALTEAILHVRARGGIVVVVAHRPSALAGVDFILAMADGRTVMFGPKEEVLSKVLRPQVAPMPGGASPMPGGAWAASAKSASPRSRDLKAAAKGEAP